MEAETTDLAWGIDVAGVTAFECERAVLEINVGHEANMRACCTSRHTSISHSNVTDMGHCIVPPALLITDAANSPHHSPALDRS